MEKTKSSSLTQTLIKILFLSQGIFVGATGITGILAYIDCETIECVRIVSVAQLITALGGLNLLGGLICSCYRCAESSRTKYLAFISWSIWPIGLMIFQVSQVYEYEQVISPPLLVIIVLTFVYGILVICEHMLHCCELHQHNAQPNAELLPMVSS